MINKIAQFALFLILATVLYSFVAVPENTQKDDPVKWYTWEEAIEANEKNPKKIMVDVYTTWCGPCKMMTSNTFKDPEVAKYLNEHYYPVKLDAEMKEDIVYKGEIFKYIPDAGRRGIHTLAYSLLDGQMRYPSIVYLSEKVVPIVISPGYKGPEDFMVELEYCAEEHYNGTKFDEFRAQRKKLK